LKLLCNRGPTHRRTYCFPVNILHLHLEIVGGVWGISASFDDQGRTPLNAAVALQDVATIERLLEFMQEHGRADDVNLLDKHGYSALHCATYEIVNEVVLMQLLRCPKCETQHAPIPSRLTP
jgi:hypothetical protein